MSQSKISKLSRPIHPISDEIISRLKEPKLLEAFHLRPAYQQNDYIGWINRAKKEATKAKRINQMLSELEGGSLYMKMDYKGE